MERLVTKDSTVQVNKHNYNVVLLALILVFIC